MSGSTEPVWKKWLSEHIAGTFKGYTATRRPVTLVWSQDFLNVTDAISRERGLKGWRREKKEALIRGDYSALRELSQTARQNPRPSASSG